MYFEQLSIIVCVKSLSQLGSMIHLKLASLVLSYMIFVYHIQLPGLSPTISCGNTMFISIIINLLCNSFMNTSFSILLPSNRRREAFFLSSLFWGGGGGREMFEIPWLQNGSDLTLRFHKDKMCHVKQYNQLASLVIPTCFATIFFFFFVLQLLESQKYQAKPLQNLCTITLLGLLTHANGPGMLLKW